MKIHTMLLEPSLERLKENYVQLRREMKLGNESSEETAQLLTYIDRRIQFLEVLMTDLNRDWSSSTIFFHQAETHRKLKLEFRFARRRWQRITSTESRVRRMQEKRPHVSTFAA